ncbi:hypothetical protein SDJN02_12898, partial [Cucurbita argyrosperma subsp. argyrosperma]
MALMRGEPLVRKLAVFAKYAVLPAAMAAALLYSPPDYDHHLDDQPFNGHIRPSDHVGLHLQSCIPLMLIMNAWKQEDGGIQFQLSREWVGDKTTKDEGVGEFWV